MLAFAQMLRDRLETTRKYRVVLTRTDDSFIPLDERERIARARHGAIFLSIHADGSRSARGQADRGVSIYTLSEQASDAEAAPLAEAENKSDVIAGVDLSSEPNDVANILIDLAQRETRGSRCNSPANTGDRAQGHHAAAYAPAEIGGLHRAQGARCPLPCWWNSATCRPGRSGAPDVGRLARAHGGFSGPCRGRVFRAAHCRRRREGQLKWAAGLSFNIKPSHQKAAPQPWAEAPATVAGP